jgi:N6-adenosine-specific RNA methylase IME4
MANPGTSTKAVVTVGGEKHSLAEMPAARLAAWAAECRAALPPGKYQVIYADPPWRYALAGPDMNGVAPYPTMSEADLCALPVAGLADKTAVLFLWSTSPNLELAIRVMRAWGFAYKTVFKVWGKRTQAGKPVFGTGVWSRPSVELLLVGARGSGYTKWKTTNSEPQEFESLRGAHSAKPDALRERVREFMRVPRRLELFARTRCPGFDAWGLEVPGYFAADPDDARVVT